MAADLLPLRPALAELPANLSGPLLVDARRLAVLLSLSVRTVRTLDAAGKLPKPLRLGGRVLWKLEEIRSWLDAGNPPRNEWMARRAVRK